MSTLSKRLFSSKNIIYLSKEDVSKRIFNVLKYNTSIPSNILSNKNFQDYNLDELHQDDIIKSLSSEFCVKVPENISRSIWSVDGAINYFSTNPLAR